MTRLLIVFCVLTPCFAPLKSFGATELAQKYSRLMEKGYEFYGHKRDKILYFTHEGSYISISYEEFLKGRHFTSSLENLNKKKKLKTVLFFQSDNYRIILRKGERFYALKTDWKQDQETQFKRIYPKKDPKRYGVVPREEFVAKELMRAAQCPYCHILLSYNQITVDQTGQYSAELSWAPYFALNPSLGVRLSLGASTYFIEDERLNEVYSLGIKSQALLRHTLWNAFVEAGGGHHYFVEYNQHSLIKTAGMGYVFQTPHWVFTRKVLFNNIYIHYSNIDWTIEEIEEIKFGIGFSF
ncbi:MAG: hypothetical protein WEB87_06120 [Bacteriovoracaceae bacterium]